MTELRFGHNLEESISLGMFETEQQASAAMVKYVKEHFPNLGYYYRGWMMPGNPPVSVRDFGSHTQFFYFAEVVSA